MEEQLEELTEPKLRHPLDLSFHQRGQLVAHFYNWIREVEDPKSIMKSMETIINIIAEDAHSKNLLAFLQIDTLVSVLLEYYVDLISTELDSQEETLEEVIHLAKSRLTELRFSRL